MWISKKKWQTLEKRVADLEVKVQGQLKMKIDVEEFNHQIKEHLREQIAKHHG